MRNKYLTNKFLKNKFLILFFLLSTTFIVTTNVAAIGDGVVIADGARITRAAISTVASCENSGIYSTYDWGCNCYDDNCGIYVQGLNCNVYFRTCWGSGCANTYAWTTGCF